MATESDQQTTSKGQWTNKPPAKVNAHPFFLKSKVLLLNSPFPWINSPCLAALSSPFHGRGKNPTERRRNISRTGTGGRNGDSGEESGHAQRAGGNRDGLRMGVFPGFLWWKSLAGGGDWLPSIWHFPRKIGNVKSSRYWRTRIFFRGVKKPPTSLGCRDENSHEMDHHSPIPYV